jgi:hypothetical protein
VTVVLVGALVVDLDSVVECPDAQQVGVRVVAAEKRNVGITDGKGPGAFHVVVVPPGDAAIGDPV